MDKKIIEIIDDLFDKAKAGDEESLKIIGEIFRESTRQMIIDSNRRQRWEYFKQINRYRFNKNF